MLSGTIISGPKDDKFLMCTRGGGILVQESQLEAVRGVEDSYNRNHSRSYEASMSACVHAISFRPTIVQLPDDIEEIKKFLVDGCLSRINNVSGTYYGRKLKPEIAETLLKTAVEPRLISL